MAEKLIAGIRLARGRYKSVRGEYYGTPKEVWGFRTTRAAVPAERAALAPEKADRIILESHFQLDGFTTFARGARAILDADRNLEGGKHVAALQRIFRRRKIGPL